MNPLQRLPFMVPALAATAAPGRADCTVVGATPAVVDAAAWNPLTPGMDEPEDAWIHTGPEGRGPRRQQAGTIEFKPKTEAATSSRAAHGARRASVLRNYGSILLALDPRPNSDCSGSAPGGAGRRSDEDGEDPFETGLTGLLVGERGREAEDGRRSRLGATGCRPRAGAPASGAFRVVRH